MSTTTMKIIPLPSNLEERAEIVRRLTSDGTLVNVLPDADGKYYATVRNNLAELHPDTHLPILHD